MILLNSWPIVLRTKSGLPKYCNWEVDRHGKRRVRSASAASAPICMAHPGQKILCGPMQPPWIASASPP